MNALFKWRFRCRHRHDCLCSLSAEPLRVRTMGKKMWFSKSILSWRRRTSTLLYKPVWNVTCIFIACTSKSKSKQWAHIFLICKVISTWYWHFYQPIRDDFFFRLALWFVPWCWPKGLQSLRSLVHYHARAKEINQVKADYDVTKLTHKNHRLIFLAVGLFYLRV